MRYYYPVGQSYCINGVNYDPGGNIEDEDIEDEDMDKYEKSEAVLKILENLTPERAKSVLVQALYDLEANYPSESSEAVAIYAMRIALMEAKEKVDV